MIEKTSPDATGETFLCPYCQTWLELPPALKAKLLAKKNEEIAALLRGRKSIIQFMKMEFEKELAKKNEINNNNEAVLSETVSQSNTLIKEEKMNPHCGYCGSHLCNHGACPRCNPCQHCDGGHWSQANDCPRCNGGER